MHATNVKGLFQRLIKSGVAYQASSVVSAVLAIFTLKVYTSAIAPADYGVAETLLTLIILCSIVLRFGFGEALLRFWFVDKSLAHRRQIARVTFWFVLVTTTVAATGCMVLATPLAQLLVDSSDKDLLIFGGLGLWGFTNLGVVYAILRAQGMRRVYGIASITNVVGTVALTLILVTGFDTGVHGYLAGNYVMNIVVTVGLWWPLRDLLFRGGKELVVSERRTLMRKLLGFGAPTVPAEISVFALNVVDRVYLLQTKGKSAAALYALAAKLATIMILVARAFQLAWPPLAYSLTDDNQAKRLYARVTTYLTCTIGLVVCALTLLGRPIISLLADKDYAGAYTALPWVALGWGLYSIFVVYITIAAHAKITTKTIIPTFVGLAVNVLLLVLLVDPLGIAGAGVALCGAYLVTITALHLLARSAFAVEFEWKKIFLVVAVFTTVTVGGELLLPTTGVAGLSTRIVAVMLTLPLLAGGGFFDQQELRVLTRFWGRQRKRKRSR